MKRLLASALVLSLACVAGCSDEAKVEREQTITTPGGTTTITEEKSIESEGSNPPIDVNPDAGAPANP